MYHVNRHTGTVHGGSPGRISDLIRLKEDHASVTCRAGFDIVPMTFAEDDHTYRALMFLCRFSGTAGGKEYGFRKCYARGCPNDRCAATYRAIVAADRYMKADFDRLGRAGIILERPQLELDRYADKIGRRLRDDESSVMIQGFIEQAEHRREVWIEPKLSMVHATEQLPKYEMDMVFLMVCFEASYRNHKHNYDICLSCYPLDQEEDQIKEKIHVANERIRSFYDFFRKSSVGFSEKYFQNHCKTNDIVNEIGC